MSAHVQLEDGNLLVVAGAGAGKTHNLVQTCLARVRSGVGVDEILIVTFTKAAAAELRKRIGQALQEAIEAEPDSAHLARQIALLDRAQISTIHSFCLDLVSRHFAELELSPRLSTLEAAQAAALREQTIDRVFARYYKAETAPDRATKTFLLEWFKGDEAQVRRLISRLHVFTQTRPSAEKWFAEQRALFSSDQPKQWREWLSRETNAFGKNWKSIVDSQPQYPARPKVLAALNQNAVAELASIRTTKELWPRGTVGKFRDPMDLMYDEAERLANWSGTSLLDDWKDSREAALMLLEMAEQFGKEFAEEKRKRGLVDFHDLEQFTLKLLWNGGPTDCARECQQRFKWIFVDEYQDINQAQDLIIRALGSDIGNRFLVGDVKQSIYGFRQAEPDIFKEYWKQWEKGAGGKCKFLSDNWRSHERILDFVNGFFAAVMSENCGAVDFDDNAKLKFAAPDQRLPLSAKTDATPRVEVHLIDPEKDVDADDTVAEMKGAEAEAELIARWCKDAVAQGKAADYGEIVILRRASTAVEAFAKVFSRHGIPIEARRSGFFACIEVMDLTNLLTILDNPLQDIPLLGVLRSPLGCFSTDDLADVRAVSKERPFFFALQQSNLSKAKTFLEKLEAWRNLSRDTSLAERLETILEETGYEDWAAAQDRGTQRRVNIRRLVELARQFDQLSGEGLYPFLKYVEEQTESDEVAPPTAPSAGAVRLMTVHQSKGLQFPVVIVAGVGSRFNRTDFNGVSLLDDAYGLCVKARPPGARRQYETIAFHLAKQRQTKRLIDEEMRILYVALTRAQNRLILVGTPTKAAKSKWQKNEPPPAAAGSMLDWLGPWLCATEPRFLEDEGVAKDWIWKWHRNVTSTETDAVAVPELEVDANALAELKARVEWEYPFAGATLQEAKSSATALRRGLAEEPELALPLSKTRGKLRANEAGQAAHRFMQHAEIELLADAKGIASELDRLTKRMILSSDEAASIDAQRIIAFWQSDFGRELSRQSLRRELRFTTRFTRAELMAVRAPIDQQFADDEYIVVQGAADLVAVLPDELWLVDFKTDRIADHHLAARVEEYSLQLRIYALALSRIYKRPVTRTCLRFLELERTEWITD